MAAPPGMGERTGGSKSAPRALAGPRERSWHRCLATAATRPNKTASRGVGVVWSWRLRRVVESIRLCSGVPHGYNAPGLAPGLERRMASMHVIAVHTITDPEGFGAAVGPAIEKIPSSMTLHSMFPSEDG